MSKNVSKGVLPSASTPMSLVEGLQNRDKEAWDRFMVSYGLILKAWLETLLGPHGKRDLSDLWSDFSLRVFVKWPEVTYDPKKSFRGWLVTTAKHAWIDFVRARRQAERIFEKGEIDWQNVKETVNEQEIPYYDPYYEDLVRRAEEHVKRTVPDVKWKCYEEKVIRCRKLQQIADEFGLSTSTVSRNKIEVFQLVRAKALALDSRDE